MVHTQYLQRARSIQHTVHVHSNVLLCPYISPVMKPPVTVALGPPKTGAVALEQSHGTKFDVQSTIQAKSRDTLQGFEKINHSFVDQ